MAKAKKKKSSFLYLDSMQIQPRPSKDAMSVPDPIDIIETEVATPLTSSNVKTYDLGLWNQQLVCLIDSLPEVNRFFHMPPELAKQISPTTMQVPVDFKESGGTYALVIQKAAEKKISKEALDASFNVIEAQKYAILMLWVKAEDAHGGNILICKNSENELAPFPTDLSRCLSPEPYSERTLPRTTRWERWPALKRPLDRSIEEFVLKNSPEQLIHSLKQHYEKASPQKVDEDLQKIINAKFNHLNANMIMVYEAVKAGLTIWQILSLILPAISVESFQYVTGGTLKGGALWPARQRFAKLPTAFLMAWGQSNVSGKFDATVFRGKIVEEIDRIKKISAEDLENQYFQELCFELRRGLFL